jgi:type IV secretory pathway ATPase VirB11/archaellum biosynthesis ATPase
LPEVFPDGKAYIVIGASSVEKDDIVVYVKSINGQPVVTPDPVVEETVVEEVNENPETSDNDFIFYILIASVSVAAFIALKKKTA